MWVDTNTTCHRLEMQARAGGAAAVIALVTFTPVASPRPDHYRISRHRCLMAEESSIPVLETLTKELLAPDTAAARNT